MKKILVFLIPLMVLVAITGCISSDKDNESAESAGGPAEVRVSGSTTVFPLAEACAEDFNLLQDEYKVSVTGGGSGVGINNAGQGISDIGMTSREIKPEERATYDTADKKFEEYLVGYDGIVVVVSKAIYDAGVTALDREQVKAVYDGEITSWKDLGGPDSEIYVVGRRGGSGTRDTFSEVIMGSTDAEMPGVDTEAGDNSEIKTALAESNQGIGYLGYNYVKGGNVMGVSLDGVEPTVENIKVGSYPLARKLYFYTFGPPTPASQAYIEFVKGPEGQAIAEENGYIPL